LDPPAGYTVTISYRGQDQTQVDLTVKVDLSAAAVCGEYVKMAVGAFTAGLRFSAVTGATINAPTDPAQVPQKSDLILGGLNIQPGQTGIVTLSFTGNYPTGAGLTAGLFGCDGRQIGTVFDVTGSAAPPPPAPCACTLMTARILPASLDVEDVTNKKGEKVMHLSFRIHWLMNCSNGAGWMLRNPRPPCAACEDLQHVLVRRPRDRESRLRRRLCCGQRRR
jgi:hypothetical protein